MHIEASNISKFLDFHKEMTGTLRNSDYSNLLVSKISGSWAITLKNLAEIPIESIKMGGKKGGGLFLHK